MKNTTFASCLIAVMAFAGIGFATAQQETPPKHATVQSVSNDQPRVASIPKSPAARISQVTFNVQLIDWRTIHSHNQAETQAAVDRLKKMGCEVVQRKHSGHHDILYRCIDWSSFSVNAADVNNWHDWLVGYGIESVVLNPPKGTKMATVRFRMPKERSTHIHDANQLEMMTTMLGILGCTVKTNKHNGHVDLSVSCPEWATIGVPNDQSAHDWQAWLNSNGFETQHAH